MHSLEDHILVNFILWYSSFTLLAFTRFCLSWLSSAGYYTLFFFHLIVFYALTFLPISLLLTTITTVLL